MCMRERADSEYEREGGAESEYEREGRECV